MIYLLFFLCLCLCRCYCCENMHKTCTSTKKVTLLSLKPSFDGSHLYQAFHFVCRAIWAARKHVRPSKKKKTITTTKQTKKCFSFPPAKFLEVTYLFLLICCWNWELERTKTNTVCHESGYKRKEKNTSAFRQGKHLLILSSIDDFNAPYLLKYSQSSLNVDTDTLGATKTVSVLSG